jgi:pimeloyl-ACP methyl ester carboxylesterase
VLLLHGFPLDHSMWNAQIQELAGPYRVIAPDLCGFGQSEVHTGTVTMTRHAEDLSDLLTALEVEEPVTVCGLSMGGYIALAFWQYFRHQLGALILCDTRAAADTVEALDRRFRLADIVLEHGTQAVSEAMIPQLFAVETLESQPAIVDHVRQVIDRSEPEGVAAALRGMAARRDMTARLTEITQPALLVVGSEDQITPVAEMRSMAEALPAGRLSVIAGAGHMAPMERPADVNAAIVEFLEGLRTR